MPENSLLDSNGKKISVNNDDDNGHEKDPFAVMLACLVNGANLPPYVVFKWKIVPKDLVLP